MGCIDNVDVCGLSSCFPAGNQYELVLHTGPLCKIWILVVLEDMIDWSVQVDQPLRSRFLTPMQVPTTQPPCCMRSIRFCGICSVPLEPTPVVHTPALTRSSSDPAV